MAPLATKKLLNQLSAQYRSLTDLPLYPVWIDYDQAADVLYLSFEKPQNATDSEMAENSILLRYRGERLVGITVFEASKR